MDYKLEYGTLACLTVRMAFFYVLLISQMLADMWLWFTMFYLVTFSPFDLFPFYLTLDNIRCRIITRFEPFYYNPIWPIWPEWVEIGTSVQTLTLASLLMKLVKMILTISGCYEDSKRFALKYSYAWYMYFMVNKWKQNISFFLKKKWKFYKVNNDCEFLYNEDDDSRLFAYAVFGWRLETIHLRCFWMMTRDYLLMLFFCYCWITM